MCVFALKVTSVPQLMSAPCSIGKGCPLGSLVCDGFFSHIPMRWPGSGVVLDCIDSWSLPSFLLCQIFHCLRFCQPVFIAGCIFQNAKLPFKCKTEQQKHLKAYFFCP